ncbi:MAG: DUF1684 domain-containing protein [Chloroflexi bacterium]|nr:DUF1684 domain-containing protein [Chloroflexota bacterium]
MSLADWLSLADWRRRVADLYSSVRAIAATDPEAAWDHWRATRDALYRTHPQSPVPSAERLVFSGRYWPYDPGFRFEVEVDVDVEGSSSNAAGPPDTGQGAAATSLGIQLPMSSGVGMTFTPIGTVTLPFPVGPRTLGVFWMVDYAGGLFLPFRDASNGATTYGAGRYLLDAAKSADLGMDASATRLILDFNFAFQPSCAFDPRWSCPLAPPGNRLDLAIEAGERLA